MSAEASTCAAMLEKEAAEELLRSIDALIAKTEAEEKKSRTTGCSAPAAAAGRFNLASTDAATGCNRGVRRTHVRHSHLGETTERDRADIMRGRSKQPTDGIETHKKVQVKWEERLEELREYKRQNGDTNLPQRYQPNRPLGQWVSDQRREYQKMQRGQPSQLTAERIRALEELGFVWKFHDSSWEGRLEELRQYVKQQGDANVPRKYRLNPPLGRWVSKQREQYQKMQRGQPSSMTADRIDRLEELGFAWKLQKEPYRGTLRIQKTTRPL